MAIYHEVSKDSLNSILDNGLMCDTSGSKSDDTTLKTDKFLDGHIPAYLRKQGVSRRACIYGYLGNDKEIIDIKTGKPAPIAEFLAKNNKVLLKLTVDETRCFVSDLDAYDTVKLIIERGAVPTTQEAVAYWDKVMALTEFSYGTISRPEIMIPHGIRPKDITAL